MENKKRQLSYYWTLAGGVVLAMLAGPQPKFAALLFVVGILLTAWVFWWHNILPTRSTQNRLLVVLLCVSPLVLFGIFLGGLLGPIGILVGAGVPLGITLPIASWVLFGNAKKKLMIIVLVTIIGLIVLIASPVRSVFEQKIKTSMCEDKGGTYHVEENRCDVPREQAVRNALYGKITPMPGDDSQDLFFLKDPKTQEVTGEILDAQNHGTVLPGEVSVLMEHAHFFDPFLFVVPVAINTGGSGTFYHTFLFADEDNSGAILDTLFSGDRTKLEELAKNDDSLVFLDSFLIGDRIEFQEFTSERIDPDKFEYQITTHYLDRPIDKSFSEPATQEKVIQKLLLTPEGDEPLRFSEVAKDEG